MEKLLTLCILAKACPKGNKSVRVRVLSRAREPGPSTICLWGLSCWNARHKLKPPDTRAAQLVTDPAWTFPQSSEPTRSNPPYLLACKSHSTFMALSTALKGVFVSAGRRTLSPAARRRVVPFSANPAPSCSRAASASASASASAASSCRLRRIQARSPNTTNNDNLANPVRPDPSPPLVISSYPLCTRQQLHQPSSESSTPNSATPSFPLTKVAVNFAFSTFFLLSSLTQTLLRALPMPMASVPYPYSSSSSDISTPRSASPSSSTGRTSLTSISKRMSASSRRISIFNPMSSVDIQGIEEAMKAQQLDQLRGYRQDTYGEVQQTRQTEYISEYQATGYQVLREPLWNKGEQFSHTLERSPH